MTLHDYLLENLKSTVMIVLTVKDNEPIQYNYWNWFHQIGQLHLLKDDMSIGHIIHSGNVVLNSDGGVTYSSQYQPTDAIMNFYFGGASNK